MYGLESNHSQSLLRVWNCIKMLKGQEYNYDVCQERHERIGKDMAEFKSGLNKVNNRFIILLTMLSMNLLGVVATLAIMWLKKGAP